MLPAPKRKAHADTHRRARVACPSPRRARYKFVRELQKGGRKSEREWGGGRVESRYDSNRAVGKYFFGRKEPREKKETEGVVFCPWRGKRRCALEDDFVALCIRCAFDV